MHNIQRLARRVAVTLVAALILYSCDSLDDDRIPIMSVNVAFSTTADWDIYGVAGAYQYRQFIREKRVPSNFPYSAMTYTGFGGILLVGDVMGIPQAYDLACPVERQQNVRLFINEEEKFVAECPECGSQYDVFSLMGHPVSGEAANKGFALRRYNVRENVGGYYKVIGY